VISANVVINTETNALDLSLRALSVCSVCAGKSTLQTKTFPNVCDPAEASGENSLQGTTHTVHAAKDIRLDS
jgi:hypothetical protein